MRCEEIINVRARTIGIASAILLVPMKARTTHSAIKHELSTERISQEATVESLSDFSVCIRSGFHAKAQRRRKGAKNCSLCELVFTFASLRGTIRHPVSPQI